MVTIPEIVSVIQETITKDGTAAVVIAGPTCSGKTSLSEALRRRISRKHTVSLISQDSYFKDLVDVTKKDVGYLLDEIDAFYGSDFTKDAIQLLDTGSVYIPIYNISTNRRRISHRELIERSTVNLFDGLHAIELLKSIPNTIKIYVATPLDVCLKRRINRDMFLYDIPSGWVEKNFRDCIKPSYEKDILPQKELADIICEVSYA